MINKYLERKVEMLPEETTGTASDFELEYYLLESEVNELAELAGKTVYGIEIVKRNGNGSLESELIRNFSCCMENTRDLLTKLAEHTVTPVGLHFILDDMMGV